jgi:hypothetical protein
MDDHTLRGAAGTRRVADPHQEEVVRSSAKARVEASSLRSVRLRSESAPARSTISSAGPLCPRGAHRSLRVGLVSDWAEIELARAKLVAYRTGRTAEGMPHKIRGLRQLAREVGMSPSGLSQFMEGTDPYTKTRVALLEWFKADRARSGPGAGEGTRAYKC